MVCRALERKCIRTNRWCKPRLHPFSIDMLKRFRTLWQRVDVSPERSDNRITHILQILDVARYFDDVLVGEVTKDGLFAKTLLSHRSMEYGLAINIQKCDWFEKSVNFLRTELSNDTSIHITSYKLFHRNCQG